MANEVIQKYIDIGSVRKNTDDFIAEVQRAIAAYNDLANSKADISSAKSVKDIAAINATADNSAKSLLNNQLQILALKKEQIKLENELLKQEQLRERLEQQRAKKKPAAPEPVKETNTANLEEEKKRLSRTGDALSAEDRRRNAAANEAFAKGQREQSGRDNRINAQKAAQAAKDAADAARQEEADKKLLKAKKDLKDAQSELNVELQGYSIQRQLSNKAAKEEAREALGLIGPYEALSKKYKEAEQNAKNLAAQFGIDSTDAKEAAAEALALNQQLKDIDSTVGEFRRSVGNYNASAQTIVNAIEKEVKKLKDLEDAKIRVQNAGATFTPSSTQNRRTVITGFAGGNSGNKALESIAANATTAEQAISQLDEQIEQTRTRVEGFSRVTEKPLFLNTASEFADIGKQITFFKKALLDLERDGLGSSQAADELKRQIADLGKQLEDTNKEIQQIASDTLGFDLFAQAVSFTADSFQVAASAAVLFGLSQEEADEATKNLVAIQGIANGVREIATQLTEKGTAANKVLVFVQGLLATALDKSAAASKRATAALGLIGIVATVIFAVIAAVQLLNKNLSESEKRTLAVKKVTEEAASAYGEAVTEVEALRNEIKLANEGFLDKKEILEKYNDTIGKTTGQVGSLAKAEQILVDKGPAYIQMMLLKAKASAAQKLAAEEAEKAVRAEVATNDELLSSNDRLKSELSTFSFRKLFGITDNLSEQIIESQSDLLTRAEENRGQIRKDAEEDSNRFLELMRAYTDEAAAIAKGNNFSLSGSFSSKDKKDIEDRVDFVSTAFERLRLERQQYLNFLKDLANEEIDIENSTTDQIQEATLRKLSFLRIAFEKEEEILLADIKNREELAKKQAQTEKKGKDAGNRATIEANLQQELLLIQAEGQDQRIALLRQYNADYQSIVQATNDSLADKEKEEQDKREKELKDRLQSSLRANPVAILVDTSQFDRLYQELDEAEERIKELRKSLISAFANSISEIGGNFFDRTINDIDALIARNQALSDAQVARISQEAISEEEKQAKLAVLEAQTEVRNNALERRKAEAESRKAAFEKALALAKIAIDTVIAVNEIKAKAAAIIAPNPALVPLYAVLKATVLGQIPFVLAAQGLAFAAVATRQIPRFYKGKGKGQGLDGFGMVNDHPDGRTMEVVEHEDGSLYFPDGRNVIMPIKASDKIYPDRDRFLNAILGGMHKDIRLSEKPTDDGRSYIMQQNRLLQKIADKREVSLSATGSGMTAIWLHGANSRRYIEDNTNWNL